MLNDKSPLRVIHLVVEIGYGDLHSPMLLVVGLHMPMYPNRALVVCIAEAAHHHLPVSLILPYLKF